MITVYGLSSSLGRISLKVDDPYELQIYGENIVDEVGTQVKELVDTAYIKAQKILLDNIQILHRVAKDLLEKETISEKESNTKFYYLFCNFYDASFSWIDNIFTYC